MILRWFVFPLALIPAFALAAGPTGRLCLTTDGAFLDFLQGGTETIAPESVGGEGPIAVSGGIVTTGTDQGAYGTAYGLDGSPAGGLFANSVVSHSTDATTDGARDYVLNDLGDVYATATDFSAATPLFSAGSQGGGIAFDPGANALFVATGGFMTRYDLAGNSGDVFALADPGVTAAAFDPLDGTLWTGASFSGGSFLSQYTLTGDLLQTVSLGSGLHVVGMEFDLARPVPEPASLVALGLGLAPLLARLRRRP